MYILLLIILILILILSVQHEQKGGAYDPYGWFRPMTILDFFRNFYFTK